MRFDFRELGDAREAVEAAGKVPAERRSYGARVRGLRSRLEGRRSDAAVVVLGDEERPVVVVVGSDAAGRVRRLAKHERERP